MATFAATIATTFASVLAAIAWDPEIRNILGLAVGIGVLFGSVYLLIGSNVGSRTGFLVTITGFFGWMATMGVIWWIYGIGMLGAAPSWHVEELNYSGRDYAGLVDANLGEADDLAALGDLPTAQDLLDADPDLVRDILPPEAFEPEAADDLEARTASISIGQIIEARPELREQFDDALGDWRLLEQSDRQRGDAAASADAFLGPDGRGLFESSSGYLVRDVFSIGGKPARSDDSLLGRAAHKLSTIIRFRHPPHYAVVQVQAVEAIEVQPGVAPPAPVFDEDAPIVSVVMVRDLGDKRFPAAMTTLVSVAMFALCAWSLHRRDAVIAKVRSE